MALIYSYPSSTPLSGLDTLLVSDANDDNRTTNVSVAELAQYLATYTLLEGNSDAADFVNGLKDLITIDGDNVVIQGLASFSSVEALSSSRAAFETKVSADQESAFASLRLEVDSEFKSYVNGKLSTYASSDAVTELLSETTATYATASDVTKINAQFQFDAGGNITGTSGALVTAINAASSNSNQAFATQVNKLNAQFDIDGDGNITGLSSANIDSVKSVVASEGYASAALQTSIRADVDSASATASNNVTAIATETSARVTKDEELVASIGNEEDGTGVYAAVKTVSDAVVSESEARAQVQTTIEGSIQGNTSRINDIITVRNTKDVSQALKESEMESEYRGYNQAFQNFKNITYADAEIARSEEVSNIRAIASGASGIAGANVGEISENKRVIAEVEGKVEATWNLDVQAGNRVAGIKIEANNETSAVTFNADAFRIYNGDFTKTPFYIENDNVYIDSATIKNISFGDQVTDVPDDLGATAIFADDASGTNPSTIQGTRNFVLIINGTWKNGDTLPGGVFNKIEGDVGATGYTPVKYTDYGDGIDGSYTTFVFLESNAQPSTPTGGTYDGTAEVMPNGGWYDEPSVSLYDTEWVSKAVYKNTKTFQNETQTSTWAHSGWSTPSKIYQKGEVGQRGPAGDPGTGINILGTLDSTSDIPSDVTHQPGDSYLIAGNLHVYDGTIFNDVGQIEGPSGPQGAPGDKGDPGDTGLDGYNGNDGIYTSFVYKVYDTRPAAPTGGTYNGATETYPSHASQGAWTDNPSVDDEDTEWRSSIKYKNTKTFDDSSGTRVETSTWTQIGSWSTPVKIYQRGIPGTNAINGTNVRIEFSANNANWSTVPPAGTLYQRTASDTNGNGVYTTFGPSVKFVPEAGAEYEIPEDGSSAFLHIKFSDDNVRFTKNAEGVRTGETPGKYMGTYVSRTTTSGTTPPTDSNTFSDYTWNKVGAEDPITPPTKFTWIKYADNIHGSVGFGDAYENKDYIGYAYNKDTSTASLDRFDYVWHRRTGLDADVKYMWVRYSDNPDGTGYVSNSAGKDYVGFAYNKDTVNPPSGTAASQFNWSKVGGTTGATGRKVVTGTLFYQQKRETKPSLSGATGKNYYFTSNSVANEVKNAGWDVKTPLMEAGTAGNNYWSVPFTAVQNAPSSGGVEATTGPLSFGSVTRAFAFNQVVTFDSLESEGTTIINGASIKTGAIQSQNYSNSSGDDHSTNGMKIDLTGNGSIHAKEFYINADGTSSFTGKHTAGELGNWKVEDGSLKDSTNRIELNPESKSIDLKNASGEVKARIKASTSLTDLNDSRQTVFFTDESNWASSMQIAAWGSRSSSSASSTTTSTLIKDSRKISQYLTLKTGDKFEFKVSDLNVYIDWDIHMGAYHTNQIPTVTSAADHPNSNVINAATYSGYHVHGTNSRGSAAVLERNLNIVLWKRNSAESHVRIETFTLSSCRAKGRKETAYYVKPQNSSTTNWLAQEVVSLPTTTITNKPTSEELVVNISSDGTYYFRYELSTILTSGSKVYVNSAGTSSSTVENWSWSYPSNGTFAYLFSSRTFADRTFYLYKARNFAELSSGGLQIATNYAKYVKIPINESGILEEENVLLEARGGRVEINNDSGAEALRIKGNSSITGLFEVSGKFNAPNNIWSGAKLGALALNQESVGFSGSGNDTFSGKSDGEILKHIEDGSSSILLKPITSNYKYLLPHEAPLSSDSTYLYDPGAMGGTANGQIITMMNGSGTVAAKIKGIIRTEGVDSYSSIAPGGAVTLQYYKGQNAFSYLQSWRNEAGDLVKLYAGWFVIGGHGYS